MIWSTNLSLDVRRGEMRLNTRPAEVEVDVPCDPTQIDHTGMPWAFLDEPANADRVVEGAIVVPVTPKIQCAPRGVARPAIVRNQGSSPDLGRRGVNVQTSPECGEP